MQKNKLTKAFLLSTLIAASGFYANNARSAGAPDVAKELESWEKAVEAGKMDQIMALYAPDAIMISTFAQDPLTKREQIEGFFQKVVVNPDIDVKFLESHPRTYGNLATNSGRYALSYTQEGEVVTIPARYTFVYKLDGDKWTIVEHHSSRMPIGEEKGDVQPPVAEIPEE